MHLSGCTTSFDATNIDFLHQGGCEVREIVYHFLKMWGITAPHYTRCSYHPKCPDLSNHHRQRNDGLCVRAFHSSQDSYA